MTDSRKRFWAMLALVVSGEAIFFLPFVLPRVFRPTMLDVFQITNFELGAMFSAYGIVAMASYFFGGPLADRYSARNLMAAALVATGLGGFMLATIPSKLFITIIYGFWGLTTILLFWAALIRATREWGSSSEQGKAFGILDAGRGLTGALIGTVGITLLSYLLPLDISSANMAQRTSSFQMVIVLFSVFTLLVAILVWLALPDSRIAKEHTVGGDWQGVKKVMKMPLIWLQAIIIVCGYVGYKITDDFSLYAQDVLGFDEVKSAGVGTLGLWLRPIAALAAGFLADRFFSSRMLLFAFSMIVVGSASIGFGLIPAGTIIPHFLLLLCVGSGVYAARPLYYALIHEAGVPLALTGTAVGVVSVVGYTPDIFTGPLMGYLLDRSPGPVGHQHLFLLLAGFGVVGLLASFLFWRKSHVRSR